MICKYNPWQNVFLKCIVCLVTFLYTYLYLLHISQVYRYYIIFILLLIALFLFNCKRLFSHSYTDTIKMYNIVFIETLHKKKYWILNTDTYYINKGNYRRSFLWGVEVGVKWKLFISYDPEKYGNYELITNLLP